MHQIRLNTVFDYFSEHSGEQNQNWRLFAEYIGRTTVLMNSAVDGLNAGGFVNRDQSI